MAKVVSQETFDNVVLENVIEFDNTIEDALADAQREFEAQGVHLGIIVKDGQLSADRKKIEHRILLALDQLRSAAETCPALSDVEQPLRVFAAQCKVSIAHRVMASNSGAYAVLLKLMKNSQSNASVLAPTIKAMVALTEFNPDIVTGEGIQLLLQIIEDWKMRLDEPCVAEYAAHWCTVCCVKHEDNRQSLVAEGALGAVVSLLQAHKSSAQVVRATCRSLKAFTLDDDIRQAFGKAHEHARLLVEEHGLIAVCLGMIKDWHDDCDATSELLSVVGKLCVRAEYCQDAVDHGALMVINDVFVSFPDHWSLNKQTLSLLKAISGNDKVKVEAMKTGVSTLIIAAINKHQNVRVVCEEGCGAVSMLSLRVPAHARQLVDEGAGKAIVQSMKVHTKELQVQKLGCMAIRNLVARVPENKAIFIELGVEEVIREALQTHGQPVKDVGHAALRDLDLKVNLVEQWRGTGHEIHR